MAQIQVAMKLVKMQAMQKMLAKIKVPMQLTEQMPTTAILKMQAMLLIAATALKMGTTAPTPAIVLTANNGAVIDHHVDGKKKVGKHRNSNL